MIVVDLDVDTRLLVAEFQSGVVDAEHRAAVDEPRADGHIVLGRIGYHRTYLDGISGRGDILDNQKLIRFVVVRGVGGRAAEYPLSLRDECLRGAETAVAASLVGADGQRSGVIRRRTIRSRQAGSVSRRAIRGKKVAATLCTEDADIPLCRDPCGRGKQQDNYGQI